MPRLPEREHQPAYEQLQNAEESEDAEGVSRGLLNRQECVSMLPALARWQTRSLSLTATTCSVRITPRPPRLMPPSLAPLRTSTQILTLPTMPMRTDSLAQAPPAMLTGMTAAWLRLR